MFKRFFLTLALAAGLLSAPVQLSAPVNFGPDRSISLSLPVALERAEAAGSIPLSLTTQFDSLGHLLIAGKVYFYQAGTVATPQNAYQDSALTLPWANPITLDATARIPQLFFADGSIKVRIADANGVTIFTQDGILVVGASSGGGGGSPVDATTVLATGDLKVKYGTGALSGFVRANGRTIGSATSGASERANSDCQTLFEYLWGADANLSVSTGRGVSAAADWTANKTIALPDWRGRALAGLDDMGNSAAGRLTATYFGTSAIVLGAGGGTESRTLTAAQIPSITSANAAQAISVSTAATKTLPVTSGTISSLSLSGGSGAFPPGSSSNDWTGVSSLSASNSISVTSNNTSGSAHATASPAMLATIYIKL